MSRVIEPDNVVVPPADVRVWSTHAVPATAGVVGGWSGQCPHPVRAGQAFVHKVAEIDCGATISQPGMVLLDAEVTQLDPAPTAGGDPGMIRSTVERVG